MAQWSDSPRLSGPPDTQDLGQLLIYVKDLANTVAKMAKDLEFIINGNLDANNIRANSIQAKNFQAGSVSADKIQAGAISADKIQAGAITSEKIQANSVTADKIQVSQLSAISANLGHITAGLVEAVEIYGSYIATRYNDYPRAEMSWNNDLFGAYFDSRNFIRIIANYGGAPALEFFTNGAVKARLQTLFGYMSLESYGPLAIEATNGGNIALNTSGDVTVRDFSNFRDNNSGRSLNQELAGKADANISTGGSGSHNHGIPDGAKFEAVDGTIYTWRTAGNHTHAQISQGN
ncbi:hypothetical protein ACIFQM_17615 [Paenibacillus sp. NRS-1782]|uniref:hypothetical protein n=1 Tax=unclassified Paenibacillus TaxID=185978 RepID=UPI003D2A086A